jgi:selenide,water dikinase
LLTGAQDNEDAAVVAFPDGRGLVQTVDFFTPIVNDPYRFGRIAAVNALSDVYAMGGQPLAAMNIVCFPIKREPPEVLRDILRGGLDATREAGAVLAGGHSVEDDEIKYGLAVSGTIDPERMATNRGCAPGDLLVLTKPIGTGVLATAIKAEWEGAERYEDLLYHWAGRLNATAGRAVRECGIRGATDVTGFGLGGHLLEMARASGVAMDLEVAAVPLLDDALDLAGMGLLPAGSYANKTFCVSTVSIDPGLDPLRSDLMFDAQTSGGLVMAVPQDRLGDVRAILAETDEPCAVVGRVLPREERTAFLNLV